MVIKSKHLNTFIDIGFYRYGNAVENAPVVGRFVARFLKLLISSGVPLQNIHVIGFSLGVSLMSFVEMLMQCADYSVNIETNWVTHVLFLFQ